LQPTLLKKSKLKSFKRLSYRCDSHLPYPLNGFS
jgi:hypothetical protein